MSQIFLPIEILIPKGNKRGIINVLALVFILHDLDSCFAKEGNQELHLENEEMSRDEKRGSSLGNKLIKCYFFIASEPVCRLIFEFMVLCTFLDLL